MANKEGHARRTDVGIEDTVYAVIYKDDSIGDVYMQEVYTSEGAARTHWRFKFPYGRRDQVRIEPMKYGDFSKKAYGYSANPFETIANLAFRASQEA